jgi:hypothetical protein
MAPGAPAEGPLSVADIAKALSSLGYKPDELVYDATLRMARVPVLARDMVRYAATGRPPADFPAQAPPELFRALPGNHTVASLIRDFGFEPVGAFLMGAALLSDTEQSVRILHNFIRYGYWVTLPDGVRELRFPPVAGRYPSCPACGFRLLAQSEECPCCGHRPGEEVRDELEETDPAGTCTRCGKILTPGLRFCTGCGAPVMVPVQQAPARAACTGCGAPLEPGRKFCVNCGRKIE